MPKIDFAVQSPMFCIVDEYRGVVCYRHRTNCELYTCAYLHGSYKTLDSMKRGIDKKIAREIAGK